MKLTIPRRDLSRILGNVARVVESRTTIPILSNLLLDARDGRLTVTGTDLDVMATASAEAAIDREGAVTLPAATLAGIVARVPAGADVSIDAPEGAQATLRTGRSRFTLNTLPAADFPDLGAGETPHAFTLPAAGLLRLLDSCAGAMSTEETRYYLNGIYLHTVEDSVDTSRALRAVATDGHRLVRADTDLPESAAGMPGIIVPRKTVAELRRLLKGAGGAVAVALSGQKIRVALEDWSLTSKLIDGTFPDYQRVIPAGGRGSATIGIAALAGALERVSAVSSERGRAVKLEFTAAGLTLSVTDADTGAAQEQIDADDADAKELDGLTAGFNASYLAELLAVIEGDTVTLALADASSPALWRGADEGLLAVLMPMRA